jgi:hypothetical protein
VDFPATQAHTGAGRIHGGVAATDDHHPVGGPPLVPQVDFAEKGNDIIDLGKVVFPLDLQLVAQVGADSQEEGFIALAPQLLHGDVEAHGDPGFDLHPQGLDELDLLAHHFPGQSIFGDAGHKEAAGLGHGFKNGNLVALEGQVMGTGHTSGARAHDGDLMAIGRARGEGQIFAVAGGQVGHKGLKVLDVQRLIQVAPDAGPFAGVRADEAADPGERVVLADYLQGLEKAPLPHQGQLTWDIDARRAGHLAGDGQELGANPGRAVFVVRVHPVFFREVLEGGENGIDRLAPQGQAEMQLLHPTQRDCST